MSNSPGSSEGDPDGSAGAVDPPGAGPGAGDGVPGGDGDGVPVGGAGDGVGFGGAGVGFGTGGTPGSGTPGDGAGAGVGPGSAHAGLVPTVPTARTAVPVASTRASSSGTSMRTVRVRTAGGRGDGRMVTSPTPRRR